MENQFRQYPLEDDILGALDALGYTQPTEIQAAVIPSILNGRDIIAKSKTGSGKTAAFAIPICNFADWEQNTDRKSTRLNSSHNNQSRMPSSA